MNSRSPYLEKARLHSLQTALKTRSEILHTIRQWFHDGGFVEVETPVRIPTPALELHIDAEPSGHAFLRTSPEFHMKRLLAAGYDRIYQIGPCFRKGERGSRHNPEYTMLEWYRTSAGYMDVLRDTEALLSRVIASLPPRPAAGPASRSPRSPAIDFTAPWPRFTVEELFVAHAGWNPVLAYDADRFERDLVARVEPALPRDTPAVVMDYPAPAGALSRRKPGHEAVAERWELYLGGIEIANAFGELTDPMEQRRRFREWADERHRMGRDVYPLDEAFLGALETGLPPCGGVALGVDRLVMVLTGAESLDEVMPFRETV